VSRAKIIFGCLGLGLGLGTLASNNCAGQSRLAPLSDSGSAPEVVAPAPPTDAKDRSVEHSKDVCSNPELLGTSRTISMSSTGGLHIGLKSYPQTLNLAEKEIVLTFDDGPLPGRTDQILDALKATLWRGISVGIEPDVEGRDAKGAQRNSANVVRGVVPRRSPFRPGR
jgi:hypothetical protein